MLECSDSPLCLGGGRFRYFVSDLNTLENTSIYDCLLILKRGAKNFCGPWDRLSKERGRQRSDLGQHG